MKIVNIILTSQNGGAEQVFIDYCNILKNKLGHEVFAIIKNDAPYNNQLSNLQIPYQTTKNKFGFVDIFTINNIKKFLIDFDADIVLTHNSRANYLAKKALKKIKNKKVFHVAVNHSMNVKRSIGADIIININKPIFYKTIDQGQPQDKSFVIHNGIDLENFSFEKKEINLNQNNVISIGVIGRFVKPKNFISAIRMLSVLKELENKYNKKFILKIAGDGEEKENLLAEVKKLNLENNVEFLGWVNNIKDFFEQIDIFILPSYRETFGLVILEAMKYQKPIISSDADGPSEILRNEKEALLVKVNPIEGFEDRLANAVIKIINDKNFAEQIVENATMRLKNEFSFAAVEKSLKYIIGAK